MRKKRPSLRLQQILDLLARHPGVGVAELANRFDVTDMTVRRDLDALEREGLITRTHGGAIPAAPSIVAFAFQDRQQTHPAAKCTIARAAAGLAIPGMTVIVDTCTTALEVAKALAERPGLRVLTSSLAIASELFAREGIELVLLGGTVNRNSPDLTGPLTEENLERYRVDLAFIGADAMDSRGLYTNRQDVAAVSRAMIASAARSVLIADSSKFGRTAFARFATWAQVDSLVVDDGLAAAHRRWAGKAVKNVIIASVEPP